jgi:outer membrane protein
LILKRSAIASTLLLAIFSYKVNAQQVISLQKAVDLTLQNNLNIKQAQFTEALAVEDLKQSKFNKLPTVSANPQVSYFHGKSQVAGSFDFAYSNNLGLNGNASVAVTLFQGGQLKNQILQNK